MTKSSLIKFGRCLGGLLLLLCLALPISQCTQKKTDLKPSNTSHVINQPVHRATVYYPHNYIDFGDFSGYIVLAAYIWPALIAITRIRKWKPQAELIILFFEVLFCFGSGWLIYTIGSVGQRLIGGYLAMAALAVYLLSTLIAIKHIWNEIQTKKCRNLN